MTLNEQLAIMNSYKDGKQIYRCCKYTFDIESEVIPLYKGSNTHYFDFERYEYSLNKITWKNFDPEVAFKYRLHNEYGTVADTDFKEYVTVEDALKLFNDGVEYGKHNALKTSEAANDD